MAEQSHVAIENGYRLAEKGALYSARAEFLESLRGIALGLDAHFGESVHTDSLLAGLRSLKEADDFAATGDRLESPVDVEVVAAAHRTGPHVLASGEESSVLAMQKYYAFTQDRIVVAAGGSPVAAEALYGLGKVCMALAEQRDSSELMPGPKAMVYLGATLSVNPSHAMAANELGVLYARLGKLHEARQVLQQSVASRPLSASWQNLAVVHRRLGETALADQTHVHSQSLVFSGAGNSAPRGTVQWVAPAAFAAVGRQSQVASGGYESQPAQQPARNRTAIRGSGLW